MPGIGCDRQRRVDLFLDENRIDQIIQSLPSLAHNIAQGRSLRKRRIRTLGKALLDIKSLIIF